MDAATPTSAKSIQLLDEDHLNQMIQWYDQQISLTAKSRELAVLKSEIAKARAEEIFALAQIAQLTQEPSKNSENTAEKNTDSPNPLALV